MGHLLGSGRGGCKLAHLPHASVGHPPASCCRAALSPACLLAGSRQEGAVAPLELARSCQVPVSPATARAGGPEWPEPHTPCVPVPAPAASAGAAFMLPPDPGLKGRLGLCQPMPPCPGGGVCVVVGCWLPRISRPSEELAGSWAGGGRRP